MKAVARLVLAGLQTGCRECGSIDNCEKLVFNEEDAQKLRLQLQKHSSATVMKRNAKWPGEADLANLQIFWAAQQEHRREELLQLQDPDLVRLFKATLSKLRRRQADSSGLRQKLLKNGLRSLVVSEACISMELEAVRDLQFSSLAAFLPTRMQHVLFTRLLPWEIVKMEQSLDVPVENTLLEWRFLSWIYYVGIVQNVMIALNQLGASPVAEAVAAEEKRRALRAQKRQRQHQHKALAKQSRIRETIMWRHKLQQWRPSRVFPEDSVLVRRTFITVQLPRAGRRRHSF